MSISTTTFNDLPPHLQGYIAGFSSTPLALEGVSKQFKEITVPATIQEQIICLLENKNCKQAMERFHLTPRSFSEVKHPFIEKVKSIVRNRFSPETLLKSPHFFQKILKQSHISPKEVYRSFYMNFKTLKQSIEKDVPDKALLPYQIKEMILSPEKLAEYLDSIYLDGIKKIVTVISTHSKTAKDLSTQIAEKEVISPSKAVKVAFTLAKELGPKIAEELKGRVVPTRTYFSEWSKTTWFADTTLYPQDFVNLLQSPSIKMAAQRTVSHKSYCYCRFTPDNCRLNRRLAWNKI